MTGKCNNAFVFAPGGHSYLEEYPDRPNQASHHNAFAMPASSYCVWLVPELVSQPLVIERKTSLTVKVLVISSLPLPHMASVPQSQYFRYQKS